MTNHHFLIIMIASVMPWFPLSGKLTKHAAHTSTKNHKKTKHKRKDSMIEYAIQSHLKPVGLAGISDAQIDDHWKLYEGYVKQTNTLRKELADLAQQGQGASLAYADRRRRFGFEMNGMVLHELYFGALANESSPLADGALKKAIEAAWGSYDQWKADFCNTGKSRGIGWAVLYMDPTTKQLINCFILDHDMGHIAGFTPLLVMDVWEHAYMVDHKAGGRADYIDAFMKNVNWDVVEERFERV